MLPQPGRPEPPSDPSMSSEDVPSLASVLASSAAGPPLTDSPASALAPLDDSGHAANSCQLSALVAQLELLTTNVARLSAAPAPAPPIAPAAPKHVFVFARCPSPRHHFLWDRKPR